jgi:hypothetical protein
MSKIFRFRIDADQRLIRADNLQSAKIQARAAFGAQVKNAVISWFPSFMGNALTGARVYDAWANSEVSRVDTASEIRAAQVSRTNKLAGFYNPHDSARVKARAESLAKKALSILASM